MLMLFHCFALVLLSAAATGESDAWADDLELESFEDYGGALPVRRLSGSGSGGGSGGASIPTPAPTSVRPTPAPTTAPPTIAPTPEPTFKAGSLEVVTETTLGGFTKATFTAGVQYAYRETVAALASTTIAMVVVANIRDSAGSSRRALAGSNVLFDTSISVPSAALAVQVTDRILSASDLTISTSFKTELEAAKAGGSFGDLAGKDFSALAITVTTTSPKTQNVISPTPAPTTPGGSGGGGGSAGPIAGAVGGLLVCVLAYRYYVSKRTATSEYAAGQASGEGVELSDQGQGQL